MNDPESIEISCVHGRLSFLKGMSILGLLISMERRKCGKKVWRRTERTSQPAKSRNNFYGGIKHSFVFKKMLCWTQQTALSTFSQQTDLQPELVYLCDASLAALTDHTAETGSRTEQEGTIPVCVY